MLNFELEFIENILIVFGSLLKLLKFLKFSGKPLYTPKKNLIQVHSGTFSSTLRLPQHQINANKLDTPHLKLV